MRLAACAALLPLAVLAACGGGGGGAGVTVNAFTGTLNVAAGTGSCASPHDLVVSATGITPNVVNAVVGDCLRFTASDAGPHQIAAREAAGCTELDQGGLLNGVGQTFTTPQLIGAKVCHWQDLENPPPTGGGGY
jgi:plastocyanin